MRQCHTVSSRINQRENGSLGLFKGFRKSKEPPPSPDDVANAAAEAFVESLAEVGVTANLDYSQESVFLLDEIIAQGWPTLRSDETYKLIPPVMGAYIGEVMVRHLDGSWTWGPSRPVVKFREGEIDPALWVQRRLNGEHHRYIAMSYTVLRVRLGRGMEEASPGA